MKKKLYAALLLLAFSAALFAVTGQVYAHAEESTENTATQGEIVSYDYDFFNDELEVYCTQPDMTIWYASLKSSEGGQLQKKSFKRATTSSYSWRDNGLYYARIPLSGTEKNLLKIAKNKDVYLYITAVEPSADKQDYTPNFILYGGPMLSKVELDYAACSVEQECSVPVISSFTLKQGSDTAVYSKTEDEKEFIRELGHLAFSFIEGGDEKYAEQMVYEEGDYEYIADRGKSTASLPKELHYWLGCEGKLTYSPVNVTGNQYNDVNNAENWVFTYAQNEQKRRYMYQATVLPGQEDAEAAAFVLENFRLYWSEQHGSFNNTGSVRMGYIICALSHKYDLDGKKFVYFKKDAESHRAEGFYLVEGDNDELVSPLVSLSEYAIGFDNDYYVASTQERGVVDLTGMSITFAEFDDTASTAKDYGIEIRYYDQVRSESIKEGDYITIAAHPYYCMSVEELNEYLGNLFYGDKVNLYMCYAGYMTSEKTACRSGKITKVSLKKPGKSPKVAVDVAKDTIKVQNGYDFQVNEDKWYTILPYNKDGTAPNAIIPTEEYVPVKKVKDDPSAFTNQ